VPSIAPLVDGMPEDLLDILNKLQLLIPPGALKPALSPNFGKNIFDGIMKLLDQFMPFLMLYKFFLPILNMIICIIEVLCALTNPFKLIKALKKLFTICIPEFLNLFPIFALILMIISLLLLLLAIIEYIISQIIKFIEMLLRNINALVKTFQTADEGVLEIAQKIGSLLCIFQNLFVILSIFAIIIQIIKDILSMIFNIPPCQDGDGEEGEDGCCTPDVCPAIIKNGNYTRNTGILQYLPKVGAKTDIVLPAPFDSFNFDIRQEAWQIYDTDQTLYQEFINIVDAHDVSLSPKPIFFPTDTTYTFETNHRQAVYTVDLKLFYDPTGWGRDGQARNIIFKNCVVLEKPTYYLSTYDNKKIYVKNGVLKIAGGQGYEEDGKTIINGFNDDGSSSEEQATLNNFIHAKPEYSASAPLYPTDAKIFSNIEYTFKPNSSALMGRGIITAGCDPGLTAARQFMGNVVFGDIAMKTEQVREILDGDSFPNIQDTQECLAAALTNLRTNPTAESVAEFKAATDICLGKLKDNTTQTIKQLIAVAFDAAKSDFTITPNIQFTSKPIIVKVNLKEKNGASLSSGLPEEISKDMASKINPIITFGQITNFEYNDIEQNFEASLTSDLPGGGSIMIGYDGDIISKDIISTDVDIPPVRELVKLDYQFIYTPASNIGDADGSARRDETDVSRTSNGDVS